MDDLISRQAAIDAVSYSIELCNKALDSMTLVGRDRHAVEVERNSLLKLKDDIKLLPSAHPERKKGRWIDNDKINFPQCSECGMWIDVMQQSGEMNYCPNCGCRMKGDGDET